MTEPKLSIPPNRSRRVSAIVLAAGEGTRMVSEIPKPLHRLCGRPMVLHVLDALEEILVDRVVVVVGYQGVEVEKVVEADARGAHWVQFVEQSRQLGTGDAAAVALTGFAEGVDLDEGDLIVLPGDAPLVRPSTLAALLAVHRESDAAATILTAHLEDPTGYGRIVRSKDGRVARVVEEIDATFDERQIQEVNTSVYCFRHSVLAPCLRRLTPSQGKGEYYLTDAIEVLFDAGYGVHSLVLDDPREASGVNNRAQLAAAEKEIRIRVNESWMRRGVTMLDPDVTYIDTTVRLDEDVTLYPGVVLRGATVVGRGSVIGVGCRLNDTTVGERARLEHVVSTGATVGDNARVGPFASLLVGAQLAPGTVTGPFFSSSPDDKNP